MKISAVLGIITCVVVGGLQAATISNGSFETPSIPGSFAYDPVGATWLFTGNTGIASNGSAFGFLAAPAGTQEAFLQTGTASNSFQETITSVSVGDTISFFLALRPGFGGNTLTLAYNGVTIFSGGASSTTWTKFTSSAIGAGAPSSGTLTFSGLGLTGADLDLGIDNVTSSSATPEPGTLVLLLPAVGAFFIARRKRLTA